jgi:hypothetical protein
MMKSVTLSLDDDLAGWVRIEAAAQGKTPSRYLTDLLMQRRGKASQRASQREALERFLSGPGFPGIAADLPTREELYAERLFRRHDDSVSTKGGRKSRRARRARKLAKRIGRTRTRNASR